MTAALKHLLSFESALAGRRVLVTGHTGFKGSWLSLWLSMIGSEVHGIALAPDTDPSLFRAAGIEESLNHQLLDIRRREEIISGIVAIDPEVVFHLAAQPLVRRSFEIPLDTLETNVLGTAYVLEGCRQAKSTEAVLCITTDKVYENKEWIWSYREIDRLGGKDPYSASKASAEIVAACYQQSFFGQTKSLATLRGGNVIGGGDWSQDRLVPDLARAIHSGQELAIRNPAASRPWQHVLSLCHGYLVVAEKLLSAPSSARGAWNLGPPEADSISVSALLNLFDVAWTLPRIVIEEALGKSESQMLALDSAKARVNLGWLPAWSLVESVEKTASWYRDFYQAPQNARSLTLAQIETYRAAIPMIEGR